MTPKEWAAKTIKDREELRKKREKDIEQYEAHRTGMLKAIKYKSGVYK